MLIGLIIGASLVALAIGLLHYRNDQERKEAEMAFNIPLFNTLASTRSYLLKSRDRAEKLSALAAADTDLSEEGKGAATQVLAHTNSALAECEKLAAAMGITDF